jgi:hypothetical protein
MTKSNNMQSALMLGIWTFRDTTDQNALQQWIEKTKEDSRYELLQLGRTFAEGRQLRVHFAYHLPTEGDYEDAATVFLTETARSLRETFGDAGVLVDISWNHQEKVLNDLKDFTFFPLKV